ncbi:hypothetical protein BH09VER1_BH09VER1_50460 [soil metagenome]
MKTLLATLSLFLALTGAVRAAADSEDLPPTTVRFSAVCEDGYPDSKEMVMKGRSAGATTKLTVLNEPIITEKDIQKAKVVPEAGKFNIVITLKPTGQTKLNEGVADLLNKQLAIIVNDELVSAPILRSVKFASMVQISGDFTEAQATKIAEDLSHY